MHPSKVFFYSLCAFLAGVLLVSFVEIQREYKLFILLLSICFCLVFYGKKMMAVSLIFFGLFVGIIMFDKVPSKSDYFDAKRINEQRIENNFPQLSFIRESFLNSVNSVVNFPVNSLVGGILVGARSEIPENVNEDFKKTGLSHIMAVSGYNITIVAGSLMGLFVNFISRKKAFWLVVIGLFLFMLLTGLQASVVRATIMGLLALFAQYTGRVSSPIYSLTIAAAIMVGLSPMILRFDIGFQLSVLATFGILYLSPKIEEKVPIVSKLGPIGEAANMTVSAQVFVLPLIIYYFHTVSLISVPANIVVLPMIPWLMFIGFFAGLLGHIPVLGDIIGFLAWTLGKIILGAVHFFASFKWSSINI